MRRALALAATLAAAACGEPVTATLVRVDARPAVHDIVTLEVTMSNDAATLGETFDVDGRDFPLTFTIETPGRTGALGVEVRALDEGGAVGALGAGATTIVTDDVGELDVLLEPADFPVNTIYPGAQKLSFFTYMGGTQLTAGPGDTFTVGFADDCMVAGRCDVWGRRFDATGRAVTTDLAVSDAQFNLNRSDVFGNDPALATAADGTMIAVWTTFEQIMATTITPSGAAGSPIETIVSTGTNPTSPAVTALPDGRFLVVWIEDDAKTMATVLRGRVLDVAALPATNPVTGDASAFTIATDAGATPATPAIAATGNGFEAGVVWISGATVRMRFLTAAGQLAPASELTIQTYDPGTTDVWGPAIVPTADRFFVVTWAMRTFGGDADTGAIVARRLAGTAATALGVDSVLARGLPDSITRVSLAAVGERYGVAWTDCTGPADGAGCGVLARVFRDSGLPVGAPFVVNTTTADDQSVPSLVPLSGDAWAVAWTDESLVAPDASDSGVRARIVYPAFASAQGVLGAACGGADDAACPEGTACMPGADGEPRCHAACDPGAATPCPDGGVCTTAAELSACIF